MGSLENNFKYKLIKNFITEDERLLLLDYTRIKHRSNLNSFDFNQNNNGDTFFYGDPLTDALMIKKLDLIKKETNKDLYPTYSFWRMYTYNADLKKHKDRPSCEYSVTVMIGSCGKEWPIKMDNEPIELEPGDGVIYAGCDIEHSRDYFEGDWHSQVFLHYIDKNGPYSEWAMDKRPLWGVPATQK